MKVRVVISGRSYDAAAPVPEFLTLPDGASLDDALKSLSEQLADSGGLPASCLVAVAGTHLGTLTAHQPRELKDGEEIVVIAPVAGG